MKKATLSISRLSRNIYNIYVQKKNVLISLIPLHPPKIDKEIFSSEKRRRCEELAFFPFEPGLTRFNRRRRGSRRGTEGERGCGRRRGRSEAAAERHSDFSRLNKRRLLKQRVALSTTVRGELQHGRRTCDKSRVRRIDLSNGVPFVPTNRDEGIFAPSVPIDQLILHFTSSRTFYECNRTRAGDSERPAQKICAILQIPDACLTDSSKKWITYLFNKSFYYNPLLLIRYLYHIF